jgi:hypothetical protein
MLALYITSSVEGIIEREYYNRKKTSKNTWRDVLICSSRQKKAVLYPRSCREIILPIPFGLTGRMV